MEKQQPTRQQYTLLITNFDFRRARVRGSKDGKNWRIEDKYGLAYILRHINPWKYVYADTVYSYRELKDLLLEELQTAKYPNVHIITNNTKQ